MGKYINFGGVLIPGTLLTAAGIKKTVKYFIERKESRKLESEIKAFFEKEMPLE